MAFGKMRLGHVWGKAHGPRSNQVAGFPLRDCPFSRLLRSADSPLLAQLTMPPLLNSLPVVDTPLAMAEHYRAKASECERKAEQARDPDIKLWLKAVAGEWRKQASHQIETLPDFGCLPTSYDDVPPMGKAGSLKFTLRDMSNDAPGNSPSRRSAGCPGGSAKDPSLRRLTDGCVEFEFRYRPSKRRWIRMGPSGAVERGP